LRAVPHAGVVITLGGLTVDHFWHLAYPATGDGHSMWVMTGHQVELAGLLIGLGGASALILRSLRSQA
jgi:hypothetical protein